MDRSPPRCESRSGCRQHLLQPQELRTAEGQRTDTPLFANLPTRQQSARDRFVRWVISDSAVGNVGTPILSRGTSAASARMLIAKTPTVGGKLILETILHCTGPTVDTRLSSAKKLHLRCRSPRGVSVCIRTAARSGQQRRTAPPRMNRTPHTSCLRAHRGATPRHAKGG
jgi:hypothetical protein